jgi:glycosyltransferase involved in cell wall biosynthesis
MRVVVVSLECQGLDPKARTASGNGVATKSFAQSLAKCGADVLVVCGNARPGDFPDSESLATAEDQCAADLVRVEGVFGGKDGTSGDRGGPEEPGEGRLQLLRVPMPADSWGQLDRDGSCFAHFSGALNTDSRVLRALDAFGPHTAVAVDWHGSHAVRGCRDAASTEIDVSRDDGRDLHCLGRLPVLFVCYRIFAATPPTPRHARAGGDNSGGFDVDPAVQFYIDQERMSVAAANVSVALSSSDRGKLLDLWGDDAHRHAESVGVVWPPLRADMSELARTANLSRRRRFVTCCSRIASDKNIEVFVDAVVLLSDQLRARGLVPALVGAATDQDLAERVRERLFTAFPDAFVPEHILHAPELADLFEQTLLLVHPSKYEGFGMGIVEAAAFGAVPVLDSGRNIGSIDVLPPDSGSLLADMHSGKSLSVTLRRVFDDLPALVAHSAKSRDCAMQLHQEKAGGAMLEKLRSIARPH